MRGRGRRGEGGRYELQTLQNLARDPAKYDVIILKEGGKEGRKGGGRGEMDGENGEVREREEEGRNGGRKREKEGREVGSPALWSIMVDVVCQEH